MALKVRGAEAKQTGNRKQMKKAELLDFVNKGEVVCVGTYWSGRLDKTSIRDKTSGARRDAYVVRETIMTDKDPLSVTRWLRDEEKPETWKPSAKRSETVLVRVTRMETNSGVTTLSGTIEVLA